jgi:hypothetical protein
MPDFSHQCLYIYAIVLLNGILNAMLAPIGTLEVPGHGRLPAEPCGGISTRNRPKGSAVWVFAFFSTLASRIELPRLRRCYSCRVGVVMPAWEQTWE